jgi:DNA replication and repair protein RecF
VIRTITFKNFRNLRERTFDFTQSNLILWENGQWKTNLLEGISIFSNPLLDIPLNTIVSEWSDFFYVSVTLDCGKELSVYYDRISRKKTFQLNKKNLSQKKIAQFYPRIIGFHPLSMNILYLGPHERRNFLDEIISNADIHYKSQLSVYKKVLLSRNKILKNIAEGKSLEGELDFWDQKFIQFAVIIYEKRENLRRFFEKNIHTLIRSLWWKVWELSFVPLVKIDRTSVQDSIQYYLRKNRSRDIMIKKTHIGPHIDDFEIRLDGEKNLTSFASRWEVKSILLGLKFLCVAYIEEKIETKPVFVIDDLLSELDKTHRDLLLQRFHGYQMFLSSIEDIDFTWNKISL